MLIRISQGLVAFLSGAGGGDKRDQLGPAAFGGLRMRRRGRRRRKTQPKKAAAKKHGWKKGKGRLGANASLLAALVWREMGWGPCHTSHCHMPCWAAIGWAGLDMAVAPFHSIGPPNKEMNEWMVK